VAFDPQSGRIDFHRAFAPGTRCSCPQCGAEHPPVHDTLERDWRHLNCFQFQASIHAKVPRVRCGTCAKTTQVVVPWARPNSGFSLRMEVLLVTLCKTMAVSQVAQLPSVSDGRVWHTLDHYVDQAHAQEDFSTVTSVGLDEPLFPSFSASFHKEPHPIFFNPPPPLIREAFCPAPLVSGAFCCIRGEGGPGRLPP